MKMHNRLGALKRTRTGATVVRGGESPVRVRFSAPKRIKFLTRVSPQPVSPVCA